MVSYNRINSLKVLEIFPYQEHDLTFQTTKFKGSIFELVDLMLSHINEAFHGGDLKLIEDVHVIYPALIGIIEHGEEFVNRQFLLDFENLTQQN